MHILHTYVSISTSYELTTITKVTRSTGIHIFHIIGKCPRTNLYTTLHIYVPLYHYCGLYTDFTYKLKSNILQLLITMLLPYVQAKNMPLSCHIYATCQLTQCASIRGWQIYMQHMNSLASTMWWGVLYTKNNNANTDNDDDIAWLHKLSENC